MVIAEPKKNQNGSKKQQRLRPDECTEANNESAREPNFHGAKQFAVRGDAVERRSRWRQKNQQRERSEKCRQHLRERHGRIIRREWTKRRQPERSGGNAAACRVGSVRSQASGDARGQHARRKIEESLREHDGLSACAGQKINPRKKCGVAGRASIRGNKLPVGVEAINAVVQPVACEFFVISRVAGIKGESPDEKEAQGKSSEEPGQEMFGKRLGKHVCGRRRIRLPGHCSKPLPGGKTRRQNPG